MNQQLGKPCCSFGTIEDAFGTATQMPPRELGCARDCTKRKDKAVRNGSYEKGLWGPLVTWASELHWWRANDGSPWEEILTLPAVSAEAST